ncbi:MAG: hypothetical protein M0Z87_11820, partial [Actinomycetota bacterium]|nr:hypothetical protein [Actinomycetota bacterium]
SLAALVPTPDGRGYWVATADGNVFNYGAAAWFGSPAAQGVHPAPMRGLVLLTTNGVVTGYTAYMVSAGGPPPAIHAYTYGR